MYFYCSSFNSLHSSLFMCLLLLLTAIFNLFSWHLTHFKKNRVLKQNYNHPRNTVSKPKSSFMITQILNFLPIKIDICEYFFFVISPPQLFFSTLLIFFIVSNTHKLPWGKNLTLSLFPKASLILSLPLSSHSEFKPPNKLCGKEGSKEDQYF